MEKSHNKIQINFYDREFKTIATPIMQDNIINFYFEKLISIINENKTLERGSEILEVGIGGGKLLEMMVTYFNECDFMGIDISRKNVELAMKRKLNAKVSKIEDLDLLKKYDLIYGTAILHHLENISEFFIEAHKRLNKNGVILFGAEPISYQLHYVVYHILRGTWKAEKNMLKISPSIMESLLGHNYNNLRIYYYGNSFVYSSNFIGKMWNISGISKIPIVNDIYIYAEKA